MLPRIASALTHYIWSYYLQKLYAIEAISIKDSDSGGRQARRKREKERDAKNAQMCRQCVGIFMVLTSKVCLRFFGRIIEKVRMMYWTRDWITSSSSSASSHTYSNI